MCTYIVMAVSCCMLVLGIGLFFGRKAVYAGLDWYKRGT